MTCDHCGCELYEADNGMVCGLCDREDYSPVPNEELDYDGEPLYGDPGEYEY